MTESGSSQKLPDFDQGKLSNIQKMYMKRVERFNKGRAKEYTTQTSGSRRVGLICCGAVLGVYFYTMWAMKQEKLGAEYDQRASDKSQEMRV